MDSEELYKHYILADTHPFVGHEIRELTNKEYARRAAIVRDEEEKRKIDYFSTYSDQDLYIELAEVKQHFKDARASSTFKSLTRQKTDIIQEMKRRNIDVPED